MDLEVSTTKDGEHRPLGKHRVLWEGVFAVAALALTVPLWFASYPPLQDFPQHVAAVRVIHDLDTPGFAFSNFFEVDWSRTQYLSVYLCAHLLAYAFGVILACKLLLAAILVALPYSLRSVLKAHGHPECYALLCLPLSYNVHFVLGFLNFLAAIPLFFWGVSAAVRYRTKPNVFGALLLGVLALLLFYTHVIPFVMLLGAVFGLALQRDVRRLAAALLPVVPALVALAFWMFRSPAGRIVMGASTAEAPRPAEYATVTQNLRDLSRWLLDVVPGSSDETVLLIWVALFFTAVLLGNSIHGARSAPLLGRWIWLLPATALGYFFAPVAYDWIWPINGRFPILMLLLGIVLMPRLSLWPKRVLSLGALGLEAVSVVTVSRAFAESESESRGLHSMIAQTPKGERVAGLIFKSTSRALNFNVFLHSVAWYQAERGGAVMFSFVDFPQSPVRFLAASRPPKVFPRWEYRPDLVHPRTELGWYSYVISREGPGELPGLTLVAQDGPWRLWQTAP